MRVIGTLKLIDIINTKDAVISDDNDNEIERVTQVNSNAIESSLFENALMEELKQLKSIKVCKKLKPIKNFNKQSIVKSNRIQVNFPDDIKLIKVNTKPVEETFVVKLNNINDNEYLLPKVLRQRYGSVIQLPNKRNIYEGQVIKDIALANMCLKRLKKRIEIIDFKNGKCNDLANAKENEKKVSINKFKSNLKKNLQYKQNELNYLNHVVVAKNHQSSNNSIQSLLPNLYK